MAAIPEVSVKIKGLASLAVAYRVALCSSLHFGAEPVAVLKAIAPGHEISWKNTFCRCFACAPCAADAVTDVLIVLFGSRCGGSVRVVAFGKKHPR